MYSQEITAKATTWIIYKVFFLLVVHLPRTQDLIMQSCLVTKEQCHPEILKQTLIARTKGIDINCLIPLNNFCIKASRTTFFISNYYSTRQTVQFWFPFHLLFHTNNNSVSEITLAISMTRMITDCNYPLADIKRESGIHKHAVE